MRKSDVFTSVFSAQIDRMSSEQYNRLEDIMELLSLLTVTEVDEIVKVGWNMFKSRRVTA